MWCPFLSVFIKEREGGIRAIDMSRNTLLESRGTSFRYGGSLVLNDINFSIQAGEFVALMGPNGSGKTTLLKTILGILAPIKGEVLLDGKPILSYNAKDRAKKLGYVSQEPTFSFPLTVGELVSLGRYAYSNRFKESPEDEMVVEEALRLTGSLSLKDKRFTSLSGGERQKVLIARVLAQTSHLLLMDEPTSHLDIYFQLQILEALKRICQGKRLAIVAVLHDLNLISLFADKALLLKSGAMVAFGKVEDVVNEQIVAETFGVNVTVKKEAAHGTQYFFLRKPVS